MSQKKTNFFLCMYKKYKFSVNKWKQNNIEAVKYNGKKWINEKRLEKALGCKNLAGNKTQYYSNKFKKEGMKYNSVKIFNHV